MTFQKWKWTRKEKKICLIGKNDNDEYTFKANVMERRQCMGGGYGTWKKRRWKMEWKLIIRFLICNENNSYKKYDQPIAATREKGKQRSEEDGRETCWMAEHAAENGIWLHCQRHWLKYRLSFVKSYLAMNNQFFLLSSDRVQANFSIKSEKKRSDREMEGAEDWQQSKHYVVAKQFRVRRMNVLVDW